MKLINHKSQKERRKTNIKIKFENFDDNSSKKEKEKEKENKLFNSKKKICFVEDIITNENVSDNLQLKNNENNNNNKIRRKSNLRYSINDIEKNKELNVKKNKNEIIDKNIILSKSLKNFNIKKSENFPSIKNSIKREFIVGANNRGKDNNKKEKYFNSNKIEYGNKKLEKMKIRIKSPSGVKEQSDKNSPNITPIENNDLLSIKNFDTKDGSKKKTKETFNKSNNFDIFSYKKKITKILQRDNLEFIIKRSEFIGDVIKYKDKLDKI